MPSFELAFKLKEQAGIDIEGPEEALDYRMHHSQLEVTWLLIQTLLKDFKA